MFLTHFYYRIAEKGNNSRISEIETYIAEKVYKQSRVCKRENKPIER